VGQPPLNSGLSLDELGVRDGELLMLESADHTAPPPLFDDIMYNVAMADADRYRRWSPAVARIIGYVLSVALTLAGCFALLSRGVGSHWHAIAGAGALLVTLVLFVAGSVLSRMYGDGATATVLCGSALPTAFTAGALFVPRDWSWSQVLVGAVLAGAFAVLALRISGVGHAVFTAVATLAIFLAPASVVGMFTTQPIRVIAAVVAAVALGALALAPRLSMLLARMPLPPVPTGGSSVDPTEADPTDAHAMPTFAELNAKAAVAHKFLAGLVAAATVAAAVGGLASALRTGHESGVYWPGTALAVIIAIVLMFRGRTYANAEEAVTLFAGGAVMAVALTVGAALANGSVVAAAGLFAGAVVLAVAALAVGVIAPNHTATPPVRRAIELVEYAFIAAVVPLVCWVAQLYSAMRGL
jgi:type VII secretion integral membrane protein EccD